MELKLLLKFLSWLLSNLFPEPQSTPFSSVRLEVVMRKVLLELVPFANLYHWGTNAGSFLSIGSTDHYLYTANALYKWTIYNKFIQRIYFLSLNILSEESNRAISMSPTVNLFNTPSPLALNWHHQKS